MIKETEVIEAGYVRIRQHVVDMIARSGSEPKKIPSVRELGRRFGLSHFTAIKAIKDLVEDGFLETRAGVGTFTKPSAYYPEKVKVIGYVMGAGKNVFCEKLNWAIISAFGSIILSRSACYRLQNHFVTCSISEAAEDIAKANYDGIIWISNQKECLEQMSRLKKNTGMAMICIGGKVKGVSSLGWEFGRERYEITRRLLMDGKKKILTVIAHRAEEDRVALGDSIRLAHGDMNVPFDEKLIIYEDEDTLRKLSDLIDFGLEPDAIAFTGAISPYYATLTEKLDCENQCTLVSGNLTTYDDMHFSGLMVTRKIREAMLKAVDNLIAQIEEGEKAPVLDEPVNIEMTYQKRGENYA